MPKSWNRVFNGKKPHLTNELDDKRLFSSQSDLNPALPYHEPNTMISTFFLNLPPTVFHTLLYLYVDFIAALYAVPTSTGNYV